MRNLGEYEENSLHSVGTVLEAQEQRGIENVVLGLASSPEDLRVGLVLHQFSEVWTLSIKGQHLLLKFSLKILVSPTYSFVLRCQPSRAVLIPKVELLQLPRSAAPCRAYKY